MKITIKELKAKTLLGVYPEERGALREVVLNISVEYDASKAAASDHMEDALDYAAIEQAVVGSLPKQNFHLLEALAEHVVQLVLAFEPVQRVTVEIDKPGALVHARSVSITHTASRK